jgi:hypothetical protein
MPAVRLVVLPLLVSELFETVIVVHHLFVSTTSSVIALTV